MAQQLTILNGKEAKKIHAQLREQYGYEGKIDLVFLRSEKKEKLSLFTKDLASVDLGTVRIDTMGMYFAADVEGKLRLTIEGSQLIGAQCTRNVVEVTHAEMQHWLSGGALGEEVIARAGIAPGEFVLVRCGADWLGCGKATAKHIVNYIPKARYIHATYDGHAAE